MSIIKKLAQVQQQLKAPKGQFNNFGKYKYRSCEDILQAVKPLLGECVITINDDIVMVGDRIYVKAIATFSDGEQNIESVAFAREPLAKKGMDDSQITGTASSYARKYALNGLLLIDDTQDADTQDNSQPSVTLTPHKATIDAIQVGIANNDLSTASEAYFELAPDIQQLIWNNAPFTAREREVMGSSEFRLASGYMEK